MSERKTDGGKGDRIPGANQAAFEAGYALIEANRRKAEAERLRAEGKDFTAHAVETGWLPE
jgi:hypothetical protein